MTIRGLLNIAMPFMRQSGELAMVMNRGPVRRTPRESSPDYLPGKTLRAAGPVDHGKVLYGLPCARCGLYYAANLAICPVCNSKEKVFPKLKSTVWPAAVPRPEAVEGPHDKTMGGLATINRELLARRVQPMTLLTATDAMPALA
jgi:hypothetical protein